MHVCTDLLHGPFTTCNNCVNAPCKQCSRPDARHEGAAVSSVIMVSQHIALTLLAVDDCCSADHDKKAESQKGFESNLE